MRPQQDFGNFRFRIRKDQIERLHKLFPDAKLAVVLRGVIDTFIRVAEAKRRDIKKPR
jgi:hypothetical protein